MTNHGIVLASTSPRRRELMKKIGVDFISVSPENDNEKLNEERSFEDQIMELAYKKAISVKKKHPQKLILGADTLVVIGEKVLGKPVNASEARDMLKELSGKQHQVITGCAIIYMDEIIKFYRITKVNFNELTDAEITYYIRSKEPFNKAGAYAIQGIGSNFIDSIQGDYYSVMGLPISMIYKRLKKFGFINL